MLRAVIYSRFSTDLQNEKSIEHQEAVSRSYAVREGLDVIRTYADAAKSGGSILGRDGLEELLFDARAHKFDVVIVEALDRLSRDMEDLAHIHKRLTHAGIEIRAIHEGIANTLTVGLRGLVGQLFREDNVHKTRRGMKGKIDAGMIASGKSYGYSLAGDVRGRAEIEPTEAGIVRRIYAEFLEGRSPAEIAERLNAEAVPGPRGGVWQNTTIYGWEKRGTGILRNPLYVGRLVWNRQRWVKDPDTGLRQPQMNEEKDWVVNDAPELRIIAQATFDAVQAKLQAASSKPRAKSLQARPTRMLSGLLVCGGCGGGMSLRGKDKSGKNRLVCTRHQAGVPCPEPKTYYVETVEDLVVEALRDELAQPELLEEYVRAYNEARQEFARQTTRRRATLERRIADLDAEIDRMLQMLIKGIGNQDRMGAEMNAREEELKAAKAELAAEAPPVDIVALHPMVIKRYRDQLDNLKRELSGDIKKTAPEIGAVMRELIHSITVYPNPDKWGGVRIEVQGNLRLLLEDNGVSGSPQKSGGKLVAGARFELTTFRL
ncbi:hypothetical protein AEAC466_17195 [Asticcacaulis sp. AC466]|uniref:recombinase family protein n=1 Tax=Asticcacaulis sp. AC466 TaxID=1282362 RepID=UPI0003C3B221|nr:recombinase family protein [Asticcacaulis sp. AC466]ESQ82360.1 hypothetical protein AEAC466_17195 [Asticcacaulis sp. AC466]